MAAGKGTRMKSHRPKVLHRLAGRALIQHVIDTVRTLSPRTLIVVTGHGAAQVEAALAASTPAASFVLQEPQLGTGHAVQQALPLLPDDGTTLILSGDVPLTRSDTLSALIEASAPGNLALLSVNGGDAGAYGRVLRKGDRVQAIVEHKDASPEQRALTEWYSGIMALPNARLKTWLARLDNRNAQREYYLTDLVQMAVQDGVPVVAHQIDDLLQVEGVNSPLQLARLERAFQMRQAEQLMEQGVRLSDPARFDLRGELQCEPDVEIDVNCLFEGRVTLGQGVTIGANCVIANASIAAGVVIHPFTLIEGGPAGVRVGCNARVGPFARLRPGTQLGAEVHVGNFVEIKNSTLGRASKANHLAYLGDTTVGERVNYGAGSITANYDGVNKHRTVIEDDVQVGSNCVLVAPLTVGRGGTVGAGSTITRDTAAGVLSVGRAKQVQIANWKRPTKGGA